MSFKGPKTHFVGNGFKVSKYFPKGKNLLERFSPFIMLDYNKPHYFEPSKVRRGVGTHPHRGFETVTIFYDGSVEHHDNKGNHGIIGPGEVKDVKGPASTFSKMNIYNIDMKNHGKVVLNEPGDFNTGLLILNGEIKIN